MKKQKALITGSEGFVGPYLKRELEENNYQVISTDLNGNPDFRCDITDKNCLEKLILSVNPDVIFHLAAFSSPLKSFQQPDLCWKIGVEGTKNLLESASRLKNCRVLVVSSSAVYGNPQYVPIDEKHPLNPVSPYAKTKVEQEKIALKYKNTFIARPFNHTGPGQSKDFVIPSFKKQIKDAKENGIIYVGDLNIVKDFSDVRDVVHAYRILIEKGKPHEIYNIGSGIGYNLKEVLEKLIAESGKNLRIKKDPKRFGPAEIKKSICDNTKIKKLGIKFRRLF